MHPITSFLVLIILQLSLASCSKSPADQDVENAIKQYYQEINLSDTLEVTDVTVYSLMEKDESTILADVNYQLKFNKDLNEFILPSNNNKIDLKLASYKMHFGDFKAGDVISKTETVTLIHTEDSWVINR